MATREDPVGSPRIHHEFRKWPKLEIGWPNRIHDKSHQHFPSERLTNLNVHNNRKITLKWFDNSQICWQREWHFLSEGVRHNFLSCWTSIIWRSSIAIFFQFSDFSVLHDPTYALESWLALLVQYNPALSSCVHHLRSIIAQRVWSRNNIHCVKIPTGNLRGDSRGGKCQSARRTSPLQKRIRRQVPRLEINGRSRRS